MKLKPTFFLSLAVLGLLLGGRKPSELSSVPAIAAAAAPQSAIAAPDATSAPSNTAIVTTTSEAPQIVVNAKYKVGEKIVAVFRGDTIEDAETNLLWTLPPTVQSEAGSSDGRRLLMWASPGLYEVGLRVSYTLDVLVPDPADASKTKVRRVTFPAYEYTATFEVVADDSPKPPKPDVPTPDPNVPLTGLAALVPDAAKRALVREFYEDLAAEAAKGTFTTTTHFRSAYRKAIDQAYAEGSLPTGIAALDPPISARIGLAIGMADAPVNAAVLSAVLNTVAQELNQ